MLETKRKNVRKSNLAESDAWRKTEMARAMKVGEEASGGRRGARGATKARRARDGPARAGRRAAGAAGAAGGRRSAEGRRAAGERGAAGGRRGRGSAEGERRPGLEDDSLAGVRGIARQVIVMVLTVSRLR